METFQRLENTLNRAAPVVATLAALLAAPCCAHAQEQCPPPASAYVRAGVFPAYTGAVHHAGRVASVHQVDVDGDGVQDALMLVARELVCGSNYASPVLARRGPRGWSAQVVTARDATDARWLEPVAVGNRTYLVLEGDVGAHRLYTLSVVDPARGVREVFAAEATHEDEHWRFVPARDGAVLIVATTEGAPAPRYQLLRWDAARGTLVAAGWSTQPPVTRP